MDMMMDMHNSFYFSHNLTHFLFEGWTSHSGEALSLICLFSGVLALLAEFCSLLSDYLHIQASQLVILQPSPSGSIEGQSEGQSRAQLVSPLLIPPSVEDYRKTKIKYHVCQTFVHVTRLMVGYFLMLAVMTFNAWIGLSVIIGCGIGYFLFGVYRENWRLSDNTSDDGYGSTNSGGQPLSQNENNQEDREEITEVR